MTTTGSVWGTMGQFAEVAPGSGSLAIQGLAGADGLKDEAIARSLGLSLRTIRAEVSALRKALAATSRFQAGTRFAQLTRVTPEVDTLGG